MLPGAQRRAQLRHELRQLREALQLHRELCQRAAAPPVRHSPLGITAQAALEAEHTRLREAYRVLRARFWEERTHWEDAQPHNQRRGR